MRTLQSRGATVAWVAVIAVVFFLAGYCLRATRAADAQSVLATVVSGDGNPVGHELVPKGHQLAENPGIAKCLKLLAGTRLAIRYHTAAPGKPPWGGIPKCLSKPCAKFVWKNMDIWTVGPASSGYVQAGHEMVDVYGTLSLK